MNKNITRSMLTDSLMNGTQIILFVYHEGGQGIVRGQVVEISLESGFTPPKTASHFNVKISNEMGTFPAYVKTID